MWTWKRMVPEIDFECLRALATEHSNHQMSKKDQERKLHQY